MSWRFVPPCLLAALLLAFSSLRAEGPLVSSESFPIGNSKDALCSAQVQDPNSETQSIFDQGYLVFCRDASTAVGKLHYLRGSGASGMRTVIGRITKDLTCAEATSVQLQDVEHVSSTVCYSTNRDRRYLIYTAETRRGAIIAEGVEGYDSALRLSLRTLARGRIIEEPLEIPITAAQDAASFARVQADQDSSETLVEKALTYNNNGDYASSSAYFDELLKRSSQLNDESGLLPLFGKALQLSNLGRFEEADAIFSSARRIASPLLLLIKQNVYASHLMNMSLYEEALLELRQSPEAAAPGRGIEPSDWAFLNSDSLFSGMGNQAVLTEFDRYQILLAQNKYLQAAALRRLGKDALATPLLDSAETVLRSFPATARLAVARLLAEILTEKAESANDRQQSDQAETLYEEALAIARDSFPDSPLYFSAKAKLAGHLAEHGDSQTAMSYYRDVVRGISAMGEPALIKAEVFRPYFSFLTEDVTADRKVSEEAFLASQVLARPGVAETQADLARALSAGGGEAAALFRQSLAESRQVERVTAKLANLQNQEREQEEVLPLEQELAQLREQQVATTAKLNKFPQFQVLSNQPLPASELSSLLRDGEVYWKLTQVGSDMYGFLVTRDSIQAYRIAGSSEDVRQLVERIRETLGVRDRGKTVVYPFDVSASVSLFELLSGAVRERLLAAKHVIFEPDGAMFRLPIGILATKLPQEADTATKGDSFDFTGVDWLARHVEVSTSVAPRSFRDVRKTSGSKGSKLYLGLGENLPVSSTVGWQDPAESRACEWPFAAWSRPISAVELEAAARALHPGRADLITQAEFTDDHIRSLPDLDDYKILHFATHGVSRPPRAGCPSEPALLTTRGGTDSDGLLTFREIYELRVDADLVLLSACDTASEASRMLTNETGVPRGGEFPLDGLVRAFFAAGARSLIASHWAVPDDYDATLKLITGFFGHEKNASLAGALQMSEIQLMDAPLTSHPFYWGAFVLVGDGSKRVVAAQ